MADGSTGQPQAHEIVRRTWNGFEAGVYCTDAGLHQGAILPLDRMMLHIGPAVQADCRLDGVRKVGWQSPGDFDLAPAGALGQWEDATEALLMRFRFSPQLIAQAAEAHGLDRVELRPEIRGRDPQITLIGLALKAELEAADPAPDLYGESLGLALALRLVGRATQKPRARLTALTPRQLRAVTDHVEAHLDDDLSLAALAATAGVSVSHFTVMFRRATGQSAHAYVTERRVLRAQEMLVRERRGIAETALATGFAHQSHLARCMKRMLGITPSQLRG